DVTDPAEHASADLVLQLERALLHHGQPESAIEDHGGAGRGRDPRRLRKKGAWIAEAYRRHLRTCCLGRWRDSYAYGRLRECGVNEPRPHRCAGQLAVI